MIRSIRRMALVAGLALTAGAASANCTMPGNVSEFANALVQGINAQRAANGLRQLQYNQVLAQAATAHACDMQRRGFFAHRGSNGSSSHQRVTRAGYNSCMTAENLASGYPQPATVIAGWMGSQGHRDNMLSNRASEMGLGIVEGPLGGPLVVLVVARRC